MPQKKTNGRQFSVRVYDSRQRANLSRRLEKVLRLIDDAAKKAARIGAGTPYTDTDEDFRFDNFPKARREIDALLVELSGGLTANAEEALSEAWDLANAKNDAMVDAAIATAGASLPKKVAGPWYNHNERALGAFMRRVGAGMNLSEDVWNLRQFKGELELALEMGLGRGKSAAELSRDVRSFLKYPDKLFRRVRDEKGVLRLSRAAQEFHPGQGVYRSSYKNALRLTATETNMAYRTADNLRWKKSPFVIGQTIEPSRTNHPVVDICDELKGDYPKDFVFTGWHPFCRCFAVPKECTDDEMFEYFDAVERGEDVSNWHFKGEVNDVPGNFKDWMQENEERISRAKSLPYFIRDNQKYTGVADVDLDTAAATVHRTPQEIAAERHAARTPDDIRRIQDLADEHTYGKAYVDNVHKLENALGVKRGKRMSHDDANTGRVNPNYGKPGYGDNCSTCSAVYVLRRMGFNVEALPRTSKNPLVVALSNGSTTWEKWNSGLTTYESTEAWMSTKKYSLMNKKRYIEFLDEKAKEPGVYEFNVGYKKGGGHSTLLRRNDDGTIERIEQQVIASWTTLDNLLNSLCGKPHRIRGIMRVDNVLFNTAYSGIVKVK